MIIWPGDEMHEGLRRWLAGIRQEVVPEMERCVNEGADASGWCPACWSTIVPTR